MSARLSGPVVVAPMVLLVPVVLVKGPLNTAPVDAVIVLFVAIHWAWLVERGASVAVPLLLPLWLIVLGSLTGLWSAPSLSVSLVTLARGLYLYLWFVTLVDFLARGRCVRAVVALWAAVAAAIALAAAADRWAGLAGGRLLESGIRAQGTFENPNMFGNYLVVSFFVAWAVAAAGRRRLYLLLPVVVAGILATGSNGALMSLAAGTGVTFTVRPGRLRRIRLGAGLVAAGVILAVLAPWRSTLADAAAHVFSRERGEVGGAVLKGYDERSLIWAEALETIERFPAGAGPGSFDYLSGAVAGTYNSAHNDYLGMLVERGPLGLLGWCALLAGLAALVARLSRAGEQAPLAWVPLAGLVAAVAVHSLVVELFHFRHVWLAFAAVAAASQAAGGTVSRPAAVRGRSRWAAPEAA